MSFDLFDRPSREASLLVGFSGNSIDRRAEKRGDHSVADALGDPRARLMLIRAGRAYLRIESGGFDPYFGRADADGLGADLGDAVLLGFDEAGPVLAAAGGLEPEALPPGVKAVDFRSINVQGLVPPAALGAMAQAASLLSWHAGQRFCGRCGQPTLSRAGGYKKACPGCGAEHFPRTDPVVIMLAIGTNACLMGRGPHFAPGVYSALAGFVEPGETIEGAVRRETLEESGISVGRVAYHASQPWPFPHSLMIGCYGEALNDEVRADSDELEDCRWFAREEVLLMLEGRHPGGLLVPPRAAIANLLIRDWASS